MLNRLRRIGFRLLYNECAFTYDWVSRAVSLGHWRRWQATALQFLPPPEAGIVLELAHGSGEMQVELLRRGYRTVALDLSPAMSRLARRKLQKHGMAAELLRADALRLPLANDSVAAILCAFPTDFIVHRQCQSELERTLQPGGSAVIVIAGALRGWDPLRRGIRLLHRLCGLRQSLASDGELAALFGAGPLEARWQTLGTAASAAQVVRLRKATLEAASGRTGLALRQKL